MRAVSRWIFSTITEPTSRCIRSGKSSCAIASQRHSSFGDRMTYSSHAKEEKLICEIYRKRRCTVSTPVILPWRTVLNKSPQTSSASMKRKCSRILIGCSLEGLGNQRAMYARRLNAMTKFATAQKRSWRIRVAHSTHLDEVIATRMPEDQSGVRVVRRHHLLVRCSHWLNVPILLGLILSGLSIYWASPVYKHKPDPLTGNVDPIADVGTWICAHVPALHQYSSPPDWVYNHISLGPGLLSVALRLHWLCAYLFMLNGLVFVIGSAMGGGWRSLLPRRTDLRDATKMFWYYIGVPFAKLS